MPKKKKAHKSRRVQKPRKARKVHRRAPGPPDPTLVVSQIGTAVAIELRRDKDGKTYRHQFSINAKLHRTRDGRHLIIGPVRVSPHGVIEG
jgi:hypothetical protein